MGYCPRCGENSALGTGAGTTGDRRYLPLRIPLASRVVQFEALGDQAEVTYGGTRFRVRREDGDLILEPLE